MWKLFEMTFLLGLMEDAGESEGDRIGECIQIVWLFI